MIMQELNSILELLGMWIADPRTCVLLALLIIAAVIDYRTYRIPNWLTLSGAVFGLVYSAINPGVSDQGLLWSLGGLAFGFIVMLPMYVLRAMGAGDVKLMAMVGAFLGFNATFHAVLCTFLVGGIASISFAIFHRALTRMLGNVKNIVNTVFVSWAGGMRPNLYMDPAQSVGKLPYGVSIAVGTIGYTLARQLGYL
jgi:prepilin peptidase CpaA